MRELYQQLILDHNRAPRNFRKMVDADRVVEGRNPLCGDRYTIYLKFEDGRIADLSFEGEGCAISKASASLMTETLNGASRDEAGGLLRAFQGLVSGDAEPGAPSALGKLDVFAGVRDYPTRVKCATLAWRALQAGLEPGDAERPRTVTTE